MKNFRLLLLLPVLAYVIPVYGQEPDHIESCAAVYEVSMTDFGIDQAKQFAGILFAEESTVQQKEIAETLLSVMQSEEYRERYAASIASIFTKEECSRLKDILADPVLHKFRQNKAIYMQNMMVIAQDMLSDKLELSQ